MYGGDRSISSNVANGEQSTMIANSGLDPPNQQKTAVQPSNLMRIQIFMLLVLNSLIFWFLFGVGIDTYQDNWLEGGFTMTLFLIGLPVMLLILINLLTLRLQTADRSKKYVNQAIVSIILMLVAALWLTTLPLPETMYPYPADKVQLSTILH